MRNTIWRLILALGAGIIVSGLCFNLILGDSGTHYITLPQSLTRDRLQQISEFAEKYRLKNGHYPDSIADMDYDWSDTPRQDREVRDGWRRPLIYQRRGSSYGVISYGADGKAGGVGFNCDLTSDQPNPPEARLSRLEILRHPLLKGAEVVAIICGALVVLVTFNSIRPEQLERKKWLRLALKLAILVIASAVVSTLITTVHIPSGH